MSKKYTHKQGLEPKAELQISIIKKNCPNLHGDFIPKVQLAMDEWRKYCNLKEYLVKKYSNVPPFNGKSTTETNWHGVTDLEWQVIANAFKSYTIEGAVEWLKYNGFKVTK